MKRRYFLILIFLLSICSVSPVAAQRGGGRNMERIHSIKVGYITDRLHLTQDQSARFWPVYNQYENDKRAMRQDFRGKHRSNADNDNDGKQFIEDDLDFQEQLLTLKRKYKEQFLQIISPQQLADLYVAEREFRKLLLQQLKNRGGR